MLERRDSRVIAMFVEALVHLLPPHVVLLCAPRPEKPSSSGPLPQRQDSDRLRHRVPTASPKLVLERDIRRVRTVRGVLGEAVGYAIH